MRFLSDIDQLSCFSPPLMPIKDCAVIKDDAERCCRALPGILVCLLIAADHKMVNTKMNANWLHNATCDCIQRLAGH